MTLHSLHCLLQLLEAHDSRRKVVSRCVTEVSSVVKDLKFQRETDRDNIPLLQKLRKQQTKVRINNDGIYYQGPYGALKRLEFDWTKFKALKPLNFTK